MVVRKFGSTKAWPAAGLLTAAWTSEWLALSVTSPSQRFADATCCWNVATAVRAALMVSWHVGDVPEQEPDQPENV